MNGVKEEPLYTGPPVPIYSAAHDELVMAERLRRKGK